jgi:hypothetical protein
MGSRCDRVSAEFYVEFSKFPVTMSYEPTMAEQDEPELKAFIAWLAAKCRARQMAEIEKNGPGEILGF